MRLIWLLGGISFLISTGCSTPAQKFEKLVAQGGKVYLPKGVLELTQPIELTPAIANLELIGSKETVIRGGADFQGVAFFRCRSCKNVRFRGFVIEGSGASASTLPVNMPPSDVPFLTHFQNNGITIDGGMDVVVSGVTFRDIASFPVIVSRSKNVRLEKLTVTNSGSRNSHGRNNTSGGILIEEGSDHWEVLDSTFEKVLGNGVWTHSRYNSPRNTNGLIKGNTFHTIGRDAVQVGHANRVQVTGNKGKLIGYPVDIVDLENHGTPVGVDTAGKVDESSYTGNTFEEVNGKCFDLDGFHDGVVAGNTCINRGRPEDYPQGHFGLVMNNTFPEMRSQYIIIRDNVFDGMKFGGLFVIGTGHKILNNRLLNLNRAHCNERKADFGCVAFPNEPDVMRAGIYLGQRAERPDPAENILIENNVITGFQMKANCILYAPGVNPSTLTSRGNTCTDATSKEDPVLTMPGRSSAPTQGDEYRVLPMPEVK
ncbi:MAG: right-handed parallel beta-helix repeat-containing protein [Bryobacterales bacterium]|nr:right-handed parallel beta-helix repeat-containing protein [Bryobacterales bacterium]